MIYLFEAKLAETKSIYFGLNSIYGIGNSRSFLICKKLGFSPNLKIKDLSDNQIYKIAKLIEFLNFIIANDLKRVNL
jgi:small subunit ribosomal protein S13